ncbi:aminotransferase class I/II-fold pyridoxal phosphate-dependent enzyme [Kitasatospora sp. NPDC088783]|uniref:aminotransferase class I/II-fold pyridoxal phosphate-dependent enzyme n=1 Tax=Kitasatospora sp. NPDC088783 TaxID=3364077 RepID=UPI0037FA68A6
MTEPAPVTLSATLAADEALARRRAAGEQVLMMASGEIGLPVLPELRERLAAAVGEATYGPVAGSPALRAAAAGYWRRRGLAAEPDAVVAGPGSKSLLFAAVKAIGGDVVVPRPSWVSYAAQAALAGATALRVPVRPGEGGVPDPDALREAVRAARAAGRDPRSVVVTLPDNPTGNVASPDTVRQLAEAARELDLTVISDEIYTDLVFDPDTPAASPALFAPERTVVTGGLTKNLAVGGWRTGVALLPSGPAGRQLRDRLVAVASQIWSSPPAPVQAAAAYAFDEPPEVTARVAAARRLHGRVVRAVAERFTAAGALLDPVRATCYLYPDFEPLREPLAAHGVHTGTALARLLTDRHGLGVLAAEEFGEDPGPLRLRAATSRLYGDTAERQEAALAAADPLDLPWIRASVDRIEEVLADLATPPVTASAPAPATARTTPPVTARTTPPVTARTVRPAPDRTHQRAQEEPEMAVLFECEYQGQRYAGFEKPVPGAPLTLYRVNDGRLQAEFIAAENPEDVIAAIKAEADPVVVEGGEQEIRYLPPLLPEATGNALLSGFMRTHRSKFEKEPVEGEEFVAPNWFFKGFGSWLRLPGDPLVAPKRSVALIEEPEVALVYVNDDAGNPRYAGYTFGNDLCDIGLHIRNPGWNPYCKLVDTSIAPWLFLGEPPSSVTGRVTIERDGATAWEGPFDCGEDALYFKVQAMVDNLFEYPALRRPGLVHYLLLGADQASYHDGFRIADGDRITIDVSSHGVVLSNQVVFGLPDSAS